MNRKDIELRDWYAGLAMQAIIQAFDGNLNYDTVAIDAFEMSEAMMDLRAKEMDVD